MTHSRTLLKSWIAFLGFAPFEKDPDFKKQTLKLSSQGMLVAGTLGMVAVLAYVVAKILLVNASISWTYNNVNFDTTVVLWDKLIILVLSIVTMVLSRTEKGPRLGRLLMALIIVVFCVSSMIDDIIIGQGYTTMFLVLFISIAVGTMPYRAWQTFLFGIVIMGVIALSVNMLPEIVGVPYLRMPKTVYVFLAIITIIYTGISGLLYSSRHEQYCARKRAEELKQELEITHATLQESYEKLSEAQHQLVHAQKIAAMGRVTAGIAHEIKNPLNFVNNFSELMEEQAEELQALLAPFELEMAEEARVSINELTENLRQNADRIRKHGKRANEIIVQMLDHSSMRTRQTQQTDISQLTEKYVHLCRLNMLSEAPELNVEIDQKYEEDLNLQVSPEEMGQVVMNLMGNAYDALQIKAGSRNGRYRPKIEVSTQRVRDNIEIKFRDNGPGIPEDIKEKVFEPFFTTSRRPGLGLSLVYEIITQRHKGNLRLESREGEGATFIVSLPHNSQMPEKQPAETHTVETHTVETHTVETHTAKDRTAHNRSLQYQAAHYYL